MTERLFSAALFASDRLLALALAATLIAGVRLAAADAPPRAAHPERVVLALP
ncbi:MAG: hypothetical protein AB7M12_13225 [Hyphomonadaceae bacterium]